MMNTCTLLAPHPGLVWPARAPSASNIEKPCLQSERYFFLALPTHKHLMV